MMKIEDSSKRTKAPSERQEGSRATGIAARARRRPFVCLHQWRWMFVLHGWADGWTEGMEGEVFRLSQRVRYRIPSTTLPLRILLRAPPSDSKVCAPRAQPRPPREMLYVICHAAALSGVWHMSLGCQAACGLPVPAYSCRGVLVACLVVTARVQREQRPGGRGDARPSWLPTLSLLCHGLAWSARVFETHALRCVQKRPHAACAQFRSPSETCANQYEH